MTMRAIFMGTPDFAVPSLDALVEIASDVLVVTQPDRKVGRKQTLTPPPVKVRAAHHGLQVVQPQRVREPEVVEVLRAFQADVLVTAAFGQLLPTTVLELPRVGAVNVHASLLPRWRGAAPIHRAIMAGDEVTGVTLMEMVLALDAGPMIEARALTISPADTTGTLHDRLAELGASLVRDALPKYVAGELRAVAQPEEGVTYAAKIERHDEFLDWSNTAVEVDRQIRALSPWPGASAVLPDNSTLKVRRARILDERVTSCEVGRVAWMDKRVVVSCGMGQIELVEVQPAGKRTMPAVDWFRGQRVDELVLGKGQPI